MKLDLHAKVILVLVAIIIPTFLIVTIVENELTLPILEEEIRQMGVNSARTIAAQIVSSRSLQSQKASSEIENFIQEFLYDQPDILRVDVVVPDPVKRVPRLLASNLEDDTPYSSLELVDSVKTAYRKAENGTALWDIYVPLEQNLRGRVTKKNLGTVHVVVGVRLVEKIVGTFWKISGSAAALSVVCLIFLLSYFLRKTIANDRALKKAESHNLVLTEQLHEAHRRLLTTEKLAVMGQLTASFAHEIGTPLNAIGGHLQLLKEETSSAADPIVDQRFEIVNGQLQKIEEIVKGFLQSTVKPVSHRQLVDMSLLADRTLMILQPRIEALDVQLNRVFSRHMPPFRAVPLDLEQILINLLNNSLDSIKAKRSGNAFRKSKPLIEVKTSAFHIENEKWARLVIHDTGEGIAKTDLGSVLRPFFTTKQIGEGTGLGLTICHQLIQKYRGTISIDSRQGSWTRVTVQFPYQASEERA